MGLKSDFTWMLASRCGGLAAGLLTGALINRSLGPAGRGVYAEMQTWVALFIVVFGLSLDSGINHYANRERYGSDDGRRFASTSLLTMIYATAGAAALALLILLRPEHVSAQAAALWLPLCLLLFCSMTAANLTVLLQALNAVRQSAVIGMTQTGASVVIIGGAYGLGWIGLKFLITYLIILQAVALVLLTGVFRRKKILSGRSSAAMTAGMVKAGAKLHIATIATFVYTKVNQLIVFRYSGETEAGIFAVALNLAFYAVFIPSTLQTALYPRVIHATDDYLVTVKSMRVAFYVWGAAVMLIILFAHPILMVYGGGKFLPAVNVFRVLMVAAWLLPVTALFSPYFVKRGAFLPASGTAVLLGIISIALNLWLVPRYASMGAAAATSLTCLTGFGIVLAFMWYLTRENPFEMFRIRAADLRQGFSRLTWSGPGSR